jgi:hypothetical protein
MYGLIYAIFINKNTCLKGGIIMSTVTGVIFDDYGQYVAYQKLNVSDEDLPEIEAEANLLTDSVFVTSVA